MTGMMIRAPVAAYRKIMGWLAIWVLIMLALMALCGCNSMARWQTAMAGDKATMTGQIGSVYGTASFVRIGQVEPGVSVTASPNGNVTVSNNNPQPATTMAGREDRTGRQP